MTEESYRRQRIRKVAHKLVASGSAEMNDKIATEVVDTIEAIIVETEGNTTESILREEVAWFAQLMETKLLKKDDEKLHWADKDVLIEDLWASLIKEVEELRIEGIFPCKYCGMSGDVSAPLREIIAECVDVANFAMMIADKLRKELEEVSN